jgi:hypothetical protein
MPLHWGITERAPLQHGRTKGQLYLGSPGRNECLANEPKGALFLIRHIKIAA